MKRFLVITATILFFAATSAEAQIFSYSLTEIKKEKKPRTGYFQQSAELVLGGLIYDIKLTTGANYIAGYRFNPYIFLGGGLGVSYIDDGTLPYMHTIGECQARLFANAKFYLTKTRVQPFFDLSVGGIYWDEWNNGSSTTSGLLFNPQFGINYKLNNKLNLYVNIGCQLHTPHSPIYPVLKLGVTF